MYGPSDKDMKAFFILIVAFLVLILIAAFALGRCTAGKTIRVHVEETKEAQR